MNISGIEINPGQPCRTVAEISNNHNGSLERAQRMIVEAALAGADFVKFQAYTPQELVDLRGDGPAPEPWGSDGWSMRDLYEKAQTQLKWFPSLIAECERVGIAWFSSVFGATSVAFLDAFDCPAFKIASLDYSSRKLRQMVKATGRPIIQSCANERAPRRDATMLYCPPGYPQAPVDLAGPLRTYDGFSYHGTDPNVPVLAASLGAKLIECHFQLQDEPSELEPNVSLTERQFAEMVTRIRANAEWVEAA